MATHSYIRASDGMAAPEAEALDERRALRPGYRFAGSDRSSGAWLGPGDTVGFRLDLMDAAPSPPPALSLRDAAGQPLTLYDRETARPFKLNADLIAAIEAEAAKLGMRVSEYCREVLRYSFAAAKLGGGEGNEAEPPNYT